MISYFESLSPLTQIISVFVVLGILFLIIITNNKRNKNKLKNRKGKSFKERYNERRDEK